MNYGGNRALWRWSQDRAGVASRWTWLQAQISDLEYKIRQHTEYHRQIRAGKGPVVLGEEGTRRPQQRSTPPVSVNGYHGSLPGSVSINMKPNEETLNGTIPFQTNNCDPTMTACRTRPFVKSAYRKRKLLRTTGLHLVSKKAARPVTVRCGCRPPLSCALCTGRPDPTRPNRFEPFNVAERIASVDFSFHPVLSFPSDTSLTIHLDAMMRLHEWQAKANRCNVKLKFNKYSTNKDKDSSLDRRQRLKKKLKLSEHKSLRKIRKHTAAVLSAKLKKKWSTNQRKRRNLTNSEHLSLSLLKIKKNRKHSLRSNLDGDSEEDGDVSVKTVSGDRDGRSSRRTSPESSPGPFISSKDRCEKRERDRSEDGRRRREDDSYDIDNIVIPYSMAAVKRVEKLQYKEILTPKWRIVDDYDCPPGVASEDVKEPGLESETEDVSDEAYLERHNRCEESEKKKFMSYIKLPFAVRSRANRRTDSRAESSGANTPDPLSPLNPDHPESGSTVSPLTTPPSTPLSVLDEQYQQVNVRKRTTSSSRLHLRDKLERVSSDKDKEDRCSTPDFDDEVLPYEPRTYPLSDEVYEEMMKGMPEDHTPFMSFQHLPTTKNYNIDHRMPESPSTSSTISAVEEDPNDPEWTVVNGRDFKEDLECRPRNKR
ncbi:hypothetical protein RUM44_000395 [Polyplax serrata]|uniref:PEHE domain-containing protein n=1 Tax=Polyplax serrata TaxID=468196 RepID=A0ABR1B5D6_POLSC